MTSFLRARLHPKAATIRESAKASDPVQGMRRAGARDVDVAWLSAAEGLWRTLAASGGSRAKEVLGMLDALEWRSAEEVSSEEFSAIFDRWARIRNDSRVDEVLSNWHFCMELGRREVSLEEIHRMFGLVTMEQNKILIRRMRAEMEDEDDVQEVKMKLALIEKAFFAMDEVLEKGFLTVDDVLCVVLAQKWMESQTKKVTLDVSDVSCLVVRLLEYFAGCKEEKEVVDGVVRLAQFKARCLTESSSEEAPIDLSSMGLHKLLRSLKAFTDEYGSASTFWKDCIFEHAPTDENIREHLVSFLTVNGPKMRYLMFRKAQGFGSSHEKDSIVKQFVSSLQGLIQTNEIEIAKTTITSCIKDYRGRLHRKIVDIFGEKEHVSYVVDLFSIPDESETLEADNSLPNEKTSHLEMSPISPDREKFQQNGAELIEAFKIFEQEKIEIYGFSRKQISELWQNLGSADKSLYMSLARAKLSRPSTTEDSRPDLPLKTESIRVEAMGPDLAALRSRLRSRQRVFEHLHRFREISAAEAIERSLAVEYGVSSSGKFMSAEIGKELRARRGLDKERWTVSIRRGPVSILDHGETFKGDLALFFGSPPRLEVVFTSNRKDEIGLGGASIGRVLSAHEDRQFVVTTMSNRAWRFSAHSFEAAEAWIADISFAIASWLSWSSSRQETMKSAFEARERPFSSPEERTMQAFQLHMDDPSPNGDELENNDIEESDPKLQQLELAAKLLREAATAEDGFEDEEFEDCEDFEEE